jgi:RNA polymerase sigma factor (sigma-70 family)
VSQAAPIEAAPPTRAQLIESFCLLARKLARKFGHWSLDFEDLTQMAMVAVMRAVDEYNPTMGVELSSYVYKRIVWSLSDEIDRATRQTRRIGPLEFDPSERSHDSDDDDHSDLWRAIDELPDRDRSMLISQYGLEGPIAKPAAIARAAGRSRAGLYVARDRSLKTLRVALSA